MLAFHLLQQENQISSYMFVITGGVYEQRDIDAPVKGKTLQIA